MNKYQVRIHTTHATHSFEQCKVYWMESYEKAFALVERIIDAIWKDCDYHNHDELPSDVGECYFVDYWDKMHTTLTIVEL